MNFNAVAIAAPKVAAYTTAMKLSLSAIQLPVRLRFERPPTDMELMRFCGENETVRVEREKNGEILIMSPSGFKTSKMNQRSAACSTNGRKPTGVVCLLIRAADTRRRIPPYALPTRRGLRWKD
jgi:hypothetical protein